MWYSCPLVAQHNYAKSALKCAIWPHLMEHFCLCTIKERYTTHIALIFTSDAQKAEDESREQSWRLLRPCGHFAFGGVAPLRMNSRNQTNHRFLKGHTVVSRTNSPVKRRTWAGYHSTQSPWRGKGFNLSNFTWTVRFSEHSTASCVSSYVALIHAELENTAAPERRRVSSSGRTPL